MKKLFTMSDEQFNKILEASKPTRYMIIGNVMPSSPQENANRAWESLGRELGFDYMTCEPANTGDDKQFYANAVQP